ncbi:cupin domain-containing protein [Halosimplex aquaticum]|uniref:Cupin domain-containing protein n=1 Tax=Halosimplex aquaticum TaxID=3026162 RepID=A0ABD5XZH3_9EURY|nr:cupin domain-containing protein [Halosimplex aquaticum]
MGYHQIDPDDLDATPDYPCDRRGVSDAAELAALHLATYEMEPGEQLPRVYHYHDRREEAFYVVSGTLHVETPDEEYVVETGEVFVAEPESPHRAYNPESADESVRVLGTGAPKSDIAHPYEPEESAE